MGAESQRKGAQTSGVQRWLIRSAENRITGPYSLDQVRGMIQQGQLQLTDELCDANTYWFYLHEKEEVRSQLGMDLPQQLYTRNAEDGTDTQTDTTSLDEDVTPTPGRAVIRPATRVPTAPGPENSVPEVPELDSALEDIGENTAVMSNRAFRDYRNKKSVAAAGAVATATPVIPTAPASLASQARGPQPGSVVLPPKPARRVERSQIIQFFTYVMMVAAALLLIAVIRLLQQPPPR